MEMQLGCCCGPSDPPPSVPSLSVPPSLSLPAHGSYGCAGSHCIGGVTANAYSFDFAYNPPGKPVNCIGRYNTTHTMAFNSVLSDTNSCQYESSTFAGSLWNPTGPPACRDFHTYRLARFAMAQNGFYTIRYPYRYVCSITVGRAQMHAVVPERVSLIYASNLGNSIVGEVPTNRINCLGSFSLPFVGYQYHNSAWQTGRTTWGIFLGVDADFADIPDPPSSITLTPA